jgi:hypothetical protein
MLSHILHRGFNAMVMVVILLIMSGPMLPVSTSAAPSVPAETGIYTEDFSTYAAKDYTDKTEWSIWNRTLRVKLLDSVSQDVHDVAVYANGDSLIVWDDYRNGNWDIYAQRLDVNGNRLWATDMQVNFDLGTTDQGNPTVALDSQDKAIVVWSDGNDVYAQRLDLDGSRLWGADTKVNLNTGVGWGTSWIPDVNVDSSGNFVVVWNSLNYGAWDIYAQRLDSSGNHLWGADVRVNTDAGTADQFRPVAAVDQYGNITVAWEDDRNGNSDIYAQRLNLNGISLWATDMLVNSDAGADDQCCADIAVDSNGKAVIVWNSSTGNSDVYAQRLNVNGSHSWAADVHVSSNAGTTEGAPDVAIDNDDNLIIAWEDNRSGHYDIYAQRLGANGNRLWVADQQINLENGPAYDPMLAMSTSGNITAIWRDLRNGNADIYAQRLDISGHHLWATDICVESTNGTADQTEPAIAVDSNGNSIVMWNDSRNGHPDIYAQRFDSNGNQLWSSDVRINSDGEVTLYSSPALAIDSDGNVIAAWDAAHPGGPDIYAQRLDANGNRLWTTSVKIASNLGWLDSMVKDGNGNVVLTWTGSGSLNGIYAQKMNSKGERLWAEDIRVNLDTSTVLRYSSAVAIDGNDNAIIVWQDFRDGNYGEIYAQKLDANGNHLWPFDVRVSLDSVAKSKYDPAIAVDSNDNSVVAWLGSGISSQRLDANGAHLWATDIQVSASTGSFANGPVIAMSNNDDAILAWGDTRNGNDDIYAQRLNASGNRLWSTGVRVNSDSGTIIQYTPSVATDSNGNAFIAWQHNNNGNGDVYAQRVNSVGGKAWLIDLQIVYPDRFYYPSGLVQSRTVDTVTGTVHQATLTANYQLNGGSVQFALSNNGGTNWITATLGMATVFTTTGSDLRWKAVLTGDPVWRQRSPVVTSLRIEYSTQTATADDYEVDDTCLQAKPIAVNGAAQAHTFHQQADADWVWFDVITNTTYILQTVNPQLNADTTLELRASCPQPPFGSDDNAFGRDARITWRATFTGRVYAKSANHTASVFGANTGYDLSARIYTQPPVVVIVGGHDNGYSLQSNIDYLSDLAYRTFLASGVPKTNIRYFSPNPNRDVDGNGFNDDIFATATITNVRDAVQDWSRTRGVSLGVPFYLYLVDHGYYDQFLAAGLTGRVFAEQLNLWLSNLEATSGADNINVILEACKSGSFIDVTGLGPNKISGLNRVVIASTSSTLDAYPSAQGAYFSDVFWTAVGQNQDLKTAFDTARQAVQATGLSQQPWLDDNGDAVANSQDGAVARGRGVGSSFGDHAPTIDWLQVGNIAGGTGAVQAQIRDDFGGGPGLGGGLSTRFRRAATVV